jgi:hypothetical protein
MLGYLDNEIWLKENPSAEKPPKKARGGVASRKAKANSIAVHAARVRGVDVPPPPMEEETSRHSTPSKAGDINFVLNAPAGSPPLSPSVKSPIEQAVKPPPSVTSELPGFTPAEPAHNRISL